MKTILLLGGSRQQTIAISKAKELGYRTVLCDYLSDNPGQFIADTFYQESTTDVDAIELVARKEKIDGIIAYASDPAALTAAIVSEHLSLPTNSAKSVEVLSRKHLFRRFLLENGYPCPKNKVIHAEMPFKEVEKRLTNLTYPIVLKPTDSSGSKGISIVYSPEGAEQAFFSAAERSRNKILIAEEYIVNSLSFVLGGDIFIKDGRIVFWGLMRCLRDRRSELIPVGKVFPAGLTGSQEKSVKKVLQNIVTDLNIQFGEFNVEIIVGKNDVPYVLELGPRAGGNLIPIQLSDISQVDLVKANVLAAMGDLKEEAFLDKMDNRHFITYVLHAYKNGIFHGVNIAEKYKSYIYRKVMYNNDGEVVSSFNGADKAIGILFFCFDSREMREKFISDCDDAIEPLIS